MVSAGALIQGGPVPENPVQQRRKRIADGVPSDLSLKQLPTPGALSASLAKVFSTEGRLVRASPLSGRRIVPRLFFAQRRHRGIGSGPAEPLTLRFFLRTVTVCMIGASMILGPSALAGALAAGKITEDSIGKLDRTVFGAAKTSASTENYLGGNLSDEVNKTIKINQNKSIKLFICGDVMLGRGIDQILPHPSKREIYEPYLRDARGYVELAERENGEISKPVSFSYPWGDALGVLEREEPDLRLMNLETSITASDEYWKGKGINYRMHPANIACLTAAKVDFCSLANNHVLDWGYSGLVETLQALTKAEIKYSGAGLNLQAAEAPALLKVMGKGRVIVFSIGSSSSGIPHSWAAADKRPGVNLLPGFHDRAVKRLARQIRKLKGKRDIVVVSIHWGGNWGYHIPSEHIRFAHKLVDYAGVDLIHGHSSHHAKALEVHNGKLIIYGCGDFINDYEGISGKEKFRDDLGLMYFARLDSLSGMLIDLKLVPTQLRNFKVNLASRVDRLWLLEMLNREGERFGTEAEMSEQGALLLKWE